MQVVYYDIRPCVVFSHSKDMSNLEDKQNKLYIIFLPKEMRANASECAMFYSFSCDLKFHVKCIQSRFYTTCKPYCNLCY